jgi:hypothetical protein
MHASRRHLQQKREGKTIGLLFFHLLFSISRSGARFLYAILCWLDDDGTMILYYKNQTLHMGRKNQ